MPILNSAEAEISYDVLGAGPDLLMIAGTASDMASWGPLVPYLSKRFRLIRIDNRGAGRTKTAPENVTTRGMQTDCLALIDHLGLETVDVLGHSLGGALGMNFAIEHPARVKKLVTMAISPRLNPKLITLFSDMTELDRLGVPRVLWFRLLYQWLFAPAFFEDPKNIAQAAESSARYEFIQSPENFALQVKALKNMESFDIADLSVPTLALAGEDDLLVPHETIKQAMEKIPNARFELIANAGHSIHWDQAGAAANAIKTFLLAD